MAENICDDETTDVREVGFFGKTYITSGDGTAASDPELEPCKNDILAFRQCDYY